MKFAVQTSLLGMLLWTVGCSPVLNTELPPDELLLDHDGDGSSPEAGDCDDTDPSRSPGQSERCNDVDDDCDGLVDDGFDKDSDTYTTCGNETRPSDCDDTNQDINPAAFEVCDGDDNNCDGESDEGFDQDQDGSLSCGLPGSPADCDDLDPDRTPGAPELCDGTDNDCDGKQDEGFDNDGDGFLVCTVEGTPIDCDDGDSNINPDESERCNGVDDNCDGDVDEGFDGDEDGYPTCASVNGPPDCNDANPGIYPGAPEKCNGEDDNCNPQIDEGFDKDGDGSVSCSVGGAEADCDDQNPDVNPNAVEVCDGIDQDCDKTIDDGLVFDRDADGSLTCDPDGVIDCNDNSAAVYPGATELCDNKDQDCDGQIDEGLDLDGDGYAPCFSRGRAPDCDDTNSDVYPVAPELCNGIDDDCDDTIDDGFDKDGDSFTSCGGQDVDADCNDNNVDIYPGQVEVCNGLDDSCDGSTDEGFDVDGDGFFTCASGESRADCDDTRLDVYPGRSDEPCDGIDNDCSGGGGDIYVSRESGYADATTIQGGITLAQESCVVVVAQGQYVERIDFGGKSITLLSESGPESTVIDGDTGATNLSPTVYFKNGEGEKTRLEGFTITGGTGDTSTASNAAAFGGGIYIGTGAGPVITGNIITGNRAEFGGGIGCNACSGARIEDNDIQGNLAYSRVVVVFGVQVRTNAQGGGFFCNTGSVASFSGNRWTANTTEITGSALYLSGGATLVQGDVFEENDADAGGTITISSAVDATFEDIEVRNNLCSNGCGVSVSSGVVNLIRASITNNTASSSGGGVYSFGGNITIEDSVITDNVAATAGAIYVSGSSTLVTVANSDLGSNHVSGSGGAGYISSGTLTISDSTLSSNSSGSTGGALYSSGGTLTLIDTQVDANTSSSQGGAVYAWASAIVNVVHSNFLTNNAGTYGGAIYGSNITLNADNCLFKGNIAGGSPGATSTGSGGALYAYQGTTVINQSIFDSNTAAVAGGAVYAVRLSELGTLTLTNNQLYLNYASSGGALYFDALNTLTTAVNNAIVGNNATSQGGAIWLRNFTGTFLNNIIGYTASRGGVYYTDNGTPYNSLILQYNDFWNNNGGHSTGSMNSPVGVNGNLSVDPLFVDVTGRDLHLQSTSPLLDAGHPDPIYNDVDGSRNQMGCFGGEFGDWDPTQVGVATGDP